MFKGLPAMKATLESLHKAGVNFSVFDKVRIEPTDARFVIFFTFLQSSVFSLKINVCQG